MLKIGHIAQMGLHIAHDTDNGLGHLVPFLPIFYTQGVIDHFLKMSAVFWNNEFGTLRVVLEVVY